MNVGIGKFLRNGLTLESIEQAFRRLTAAVTAGFLIEHKEDGTHSAVTADAITLGSDPSDGSWEGNVSGSLVPTTDGSDLGAVVTGKSGEDPRDHPWRDLRISRRLYVGAAWEATVIEGVPFLEFDGTALTLDADAQPGGIVLTGSTAGTLEMALGNLNYDGNIEAAGAVVAGADGFFERSRVTAVGEWIAVAYNAANFTASAGTWGVDSGDQVTYRYTLVGKTMTLAWAIKETDVSSAAQLRIAIPGSHTAAVTAIGVYRALNAGGVAVAALCSVSSGGTFVSLSADMDGNNFSVTSGDNTWVQGTFTFEVQ